MNRGLKILELIIRYYLLPPESRAWIHGYFTPAQIRRAKRKAALITLTVQAAAITAVALFLLPGDHPMALPTAIGLGTGIPFLAATTQSWKRPN